MAPPLPPAPKPAAQEDPVLDDDFARQLQASMAGLLGQLDNNPDMQRDFEEMMKDLGAADQSLAAREPQKSESSPDEIAKNLPAGFEDAFKGNQDLEEMMKQMMAGFDPAAAGLSSDSTPAPAAAASGASPSPTASTTSKPTPATSKKPAESSFQDTIRKTMERMQTSGDTASAAAAGSGEDDILAQMLKEMENGDFGGGDEEDLNKMLMGMMEQLTNKDILYDPMKELHDKFPAWLRENKATTSKEDLARYEEQQQVVGEIVARFERNQYSDDSNADREYIVERMQKVMLPCTLPNLTRLTVIPDASSWLSSSRSSGRHEFRTRSSR